MKNYYEILEVSRDASATEIKRIYRILAKKYHPDKNKDDSEAIKKFQEISEAYSILGDEKSRTEYDKKIDKFKTKGSYSNGGFSKNNDKNKRNSKPMNEQSFEDLNKTFENFFGFNAKTSDVTKEKINKKKNPIDTTDIFENFFKKK